MKHFRCFYIFLLVMLIDTTSIAQFKNSIWCFGDSAGINFSNPNAPFPFETGMRSRGTSVSIADNNDSLLFYANTRSNTVGVNSGRVYNRMHSIMQNGTNIVGDGWYYEYVIVPNPNDTNMFYLFTTAVTLAYGIYYSVIDMTLDSGRGAVTLKNVQLQSDTINDGLVAIKHGNGRDWWLFYRIYNPSISGGNNDFYSYLVTPSGITNFNLQSIGSNNPANTCRIKFNKGGSKLAVFNFEGLIELYDFDRCSGMLSNSVTIAGNSPPFPVYIGCEFSPDGSKLFVSSVPYDSYLFQYDLNAPNIAASKDTLWSVTNIEYAAGELKRGPDDKIYFSCAYTNPSFATYPYQDSIYNMYNMNLSVINSPDSLGAACNFLPYSFYLGGKRCYYGLPNNPDYEMKPLYGSVCDSLSTGIENPPASKGGELFVTYVSEWEKAFINAQYLKGTTYTLTVSDITGRQIFKEKGGLHPPYFTKDLDCSGFANGMYIVTVITDKERLSNKFVKQ